MKRSQETCHRSALYFSRGWEGDVYLCFAIGISRPMREYTGMTKHLANTERCFFFVYI